MRSGKVQENFDEFNEGEEDVPLGFYTPRGKRTQCTTDPDPPRNQKERGRKKEKMKRGGWTR